ncbi:MAG: arsenate reductase (azurin) small subunit [Pseudomonadota bacterium]|nr:arsenate reductase (azurin) small subunit [Pseudomonadota bacterium]
MTDSTKNDPRKDQTASEHGKCMMSRRKFLLYSGAGAAAASTISITLFPGTAQAAQAKARVVGYPRKKIASLSSLVDNEPVDFNYPDEGPNSQCMIVKMEGVKAGGGIGEQRDIVAFSYLCTHQGGPMQGQYKVKDEHRVLGQCPLHLSTYDLRRHGIIVSGQAYESLPQVLLEVDGDDIYAVGMMGLLFGRNKNLMES